MHMFLTVGQQTRQHHIFIHSVYVGKIQERKCRKLHGTNKDYITTCTKRASFKLLCTSQSSSVLELAATYNNNKIFNKCLTNSRVERGVMKMQKEAQQKEKQKYC